LAASRTKTRPRPVYFETTIPVIRRHSCGVWLAAGVAEGIKAEIELVRLDTYQRLWCVCARIQMFALRRSGLIQMDAGRLADPRFVDLFPQHHCHVQWPQPPPVRVAERYDSGIPPY
jgi:hypothetical protein